MSNNNLDKINSTGWKVFGLIGGLAIVAAASIIKIIKNNTGFINEKQEQFIGLSLMFSEFIKKSRHNINDESKKIENFLKEKFKIPGTGDFSLLINELISKKRIDAETFARFYKNMNYSVRLQMFRLLVKSQKNKNDFNDMEHSFVEIAQMLNLEKQDYRSVLAINHSGIQAAYELLQVDEHSSENEIKASFRRLSKIYHPDKVEHLGNEYKDEAAENFQELLNAYELIKSAHKI